ncbi:MAG: AI-2E family transporter [Verrucomicrobia bacterium]|nr:AI-2E family transporter [Verrucomicrobiota bacterium]MCH8513782.1 AI-2E family transporter [Kiritimatiellia bacterium]
MNQSALTRGLVSMAAFVIFISGLRAANYIIVPFMLAVFIAVITSPLMVWLRKRGMRPSFSVLVIVMMVIGVLWTFLQVVGPSITQFIGRSGEYITQLRGITRNWVLWLQDKNVDIELETVNAIFDPVNIMRNTANALSFLQGMLTNTFLILITVVFLLLELAGLPQKLRLAFGPDHPSIHGWELFADSLNRYLAIKSVVSLMTGICAYTLVRLLNVEFALLWGMLAFMLNYVPNIGSILAAVPPVMVALATLDTPRAIYVLIGYICINVIFGNLLEPRIMGKGLGLSTLVVWLSLIFWGWVFGPVGMLLSVPLTMVVKIAMESRQETMWLAVLLASDPGEAVDLPVLEGSDNQDWIEADAEEDSKQASEKSDTD